MMAIDEPLVHQEHVPSTFIASAKAGIRRARESLKAAWAELDELEDRIAARDHETDRGRSTSPRSERLTAAELCAAKRRSLASIQRDMRAGLPCTYVGSSPRFDVQAVDAWYGERAAAAKEVRAAKRAAVVREGAPVVRMMRGGAR